MIINSPVYVKKNHLIILINKKKTKITASQKLINALLTIPWSPFYASLELKALSLQKLHLSTHLDNRFNEKQIQQIMLMGIE